MNVPRGAKELIDEFWKKHSKKGAPRKSDAKPKPTPKPRKSAARATTHESEVESVSAPAKKRGRQSKASARSPSEEQEEAEEDVPKKKPRKGSNATKSASARRAVARPEDSDQEEEERVYVDMSKWKDAASWEHLIECIDTVERTEDNELLVYFTLYVCGPWTCAALFVRPDLSVHTCTDGGYACLTSQEKREGLRKGDHRSLQEEDAKLGASSFYRHRQCSSYGIYHLCPPAPAY